MNQTNDSNTGSQPPSIGWTKHFAAWLGLSPERTRWFLIVAVLVVLLCLGGWGGLALLKPEVAIYAIIGLVAVVLALLLFCLLAHSRSFCVEGNPRPKRNHLTIKTPNSRIDWTQEQLQDPLGVHHNKRTHEQKQDYGFPGNALNDGIAATPEVIGGSPSQGEQTGKLVAGMHNTSFREFIGTLQKSSNVVFINIQVDLVEWFDPWTQVHLALQDCAYHHIQMSWLLRLLSEQKRDAATVMLTPFRRILVIPEKWSVLRDKISSQVYPECNLLPLILIHTCMGCPLAIVTADRFVTHVFLKNREFFKDAANNSTIGLPYEKMIMMESQTSQAGDILRKAFDAMAMKRGVLTPSIDCALLSFGNGDTPAVWKAALDPKGIASYFAVTNKDLNAIRDKGINIDACANAEMVSSRVREMTQIIAGIVFEEVGVSSLNSHASENEFNPILSALTMVQTDSLSTTIVRAKEEFDPFALLSEAGVL